MSRNSARRVIRKLMSVRTVNIALAVVALVLVVLRWGAVQRRIQYWLTGAVHVEGVTLYLPSDDPFLDYLLNNGSWEPSETALLRDQLNPGDTFIDVGAHFGYYTVIAAELVGEKGHVIAFEPDPVNFAALKHNIEMNDLTNVTLEQKALSNQTGTISFFLHQKHRMNQSMFDFGDSKASIEVPSVRLDDYLTDFSRRIDVIKVDTEGAEGVIIDGMPETLRRNSDVKLLIEFSPARLRFVGFDPDDLLARLTSMGFSICSIDEANGDLVPLSTDKAGGLRETNLLVRRTRH